MFAGLLDFGRSSVQWLLGLSIDLAGKFGWFVGHGLRGDVAAWWLVARWHVRHGGWGIAFLCLTPNSWRLRRILYLLFHFPSFQPGSKNLIGFCALNLVQNGFHTSLVFFFFRARSVYSDRSIGWIGEWEDQTIPLLSMEFPPECVSFYIPMLWLRNGLFDQHLLKISG